MQVLRNCFCLMCVAAPICLSGCSPDRAPIPVASEMEAADESPDTAAENEQVPLVAIAGTRVTMPQPEGFELAEGFPGFAQPDSGASIMVTELPGAFAEFSGGFTKERLLSRGMELIDKQNITLDGRPGLLCQIEQEAAGNTFAKWIALSGDDENTVMITAACPKQSGQQLSEKLKSAVLQTRVAESGPADPMEGLSFTIDVADGLKFAQRVSNMLMYTRNGTIPTEFPSDPLFIAGRAVSKVPIGDLKSFAEGRIRGTAEVADLKIVNSEPITVDQLKGHAIQATAKDAETGIPLVVYQVILQTDKSYYIFQGLVGEDQKNEYLPKFEQMVNAFRQK